MTGYVALLTRHVINGEYFERCYDDVNICLWSDGSQLDWSESQKACKQPRVTSAAIQDKLAEFRDASGRLIGEDGFWIDVRADNSSDFHWINGSSLAGWFLPHNALQCKARSCYRCVHLLSWWIVTT